MKAWGKIIWIPLPITIGVIALIFAVILSIAFIALPQYRDEVRFIAAVAVAAAAITSAFYVGQGLRIRGENARMQATLRYIEQWNRPEFFHGKKAWRLIMRRIVANPNADRVQAVREVLATEGDQDTNEANLFEVLNFFEGLGAAVLYGAIKEEMAADYFKTVVCRTYEHLDEWIKERRREGGPRVYRQLEGLYNRWRT